MKMYLIFQATTNRSGLQENSIFYFSRRIVRRNRIRDFPLDDISRKMIMSISHSKKDIKIGKD